MLQRPIGSSGKVEVYKIIDDPRKLVSKDWDQVVACFVTGQLWQFKGWKYETPVHLFQNVLGVHLLLDGRVLDPVIKSWNCQILKIHEVKQHVNAGAAQQFWSMIDDFVRLNKPHLDNVKDIR
jgi:parafibromin